MTQYLKERYFFGINSFIFLIYIACLTSCSAAQTLKDKSGCSIPEKYERVLISSAVPYQSWQVRATNGVFTWNGAITNETELQYFAGQLAKLPVDAGSAVFQVTESVSCEDRVRVRSALVRSGLCQQGRCWEIERVVKVPIVHSSGPQ